VNRYRRDVDAVLVRQVNELAELVFGEEREGTACEFEAVYVVAHSDGSEYAEWHGEEAGKTHVSSTSLR